MREKQAMIATELVAVGQASLLKVQKRVVACQGCSASVSRSFGSVMIEVLGAANPGSQYLMLGPARCPACSRPIYETTRVRCEGEIAGPDSDEIKEFAPCWEDTDVVLIDEDMLSKAENFVTGCERCVEHAEMTFEYILDEITGCDPTSTEYVMCHAAKCPGCFQDITEKTLIIAQ